MFQSVYQMCSTDGAARFGLLLGLFLAGAAGSVMHCAPMCGAFVLGQVADRMARLPRAALCESRRIAEGMLLPYHLGRVAIYAALGALGATTAQILGHARWFGALSGVLLVLAAALFLAHAARRLLPPGRLAGRLSWLDRAPRAWVALIGRVTRRLQRQSWGGELLLGAALGFLPCGFLYGALAAASATARPWQGAAAMLAFGLGTAPVLMLVGIAGQAAGRRWNRFISAAAPVLMALNAALLLLLAWQQLA